MVFSFSILIVPNLFEIKKLNIFDVQQVHSQKQHLTKFYQVCVSFNLALSIIYFPTNFIKKNTNNTEVMIYDGLLGGDYT